MKNDAAVKFLLEKGASTEFRDPTNGESLAHLSARIGNMHALKLLTKYDSVDFAGNTPLHAAVRHQNFEAIQHLVSACNTIINVSNSNGRTCLHEAVANGDWTLTRYLLYHGAVRKVFA